MLTAPTCPPAALYRKMHGLHGLSPKGWEGVAKMETNFVGKYTWPHMGHQRQPKFLDLLPPPPPGIGRLDPP